MNWLLPAVISTFTATIVLSAVYSYLAIIENQNFIKKWAIGWWVYAIRFLLMIWMLITSEHVLLIIGNQSAALISGVVLLWGTYEFLERKIPKVWFVVSGLIQAWIIGGILAELPFLFFSIPTYTFLGAVYIWTGFTLLRSIKIKSMGASITGYTFILWGIHKVNYPFLRSVVWFAPWGYFLASLFELLVALGILLTYFQKNKQELSHALDNLHIQQQLLNKSQEIAHIGSWHLDIKRNVLTWSDENYRVFGRSKEKFECTYEAFLDTIHPDDRDMVDKTYTYAIKNNVPYECVHRIIRNDGEVRTVLEKSEDIVDENNETIHSFGVAQDITERKQAEEALSRSEQRYRELFDNAPIMYVITTSVKGEPIIEDCNDAFLEALGYTRDQINGQPLSNFYSDASKNALNEGGYRQALSHSLDHVERDLVKKDGSLLHTLLRATPRGLPGSSEGTLAMFVDVTERKQAEGEKEKLEEQLRQSQKMEAVGTMAGGIAHDFNNILTIIIGNADVLSDEFPDDHPGREPVEEIIKASDRAKELVSQILAFSRIEKKELIPIQPHLMIQETLKLLRSTTPTTVSIIQNISQDCSKIKADPTGLHQILMNLFTNAVHSMDEKGEVTVSLQEVNLDSDQLDQPAATTKFFSIKTPGAYMRLSVTDNGTGMDEKTVERIFDPFYTTKEVGKGTGMGLSVVHGIVESHGGFIDVDSEPGQGSTFHVFIPITEAEDEEFVEAATIPPQTGTERILLIDDEEALLMLGKRILDKLGYKVTAENSSVKALEVFKSAPDQFDLIVTDQSMPDMSGTELVAEILKVRPDMPVILCTGFSSKVSEENAKELGISKFITKPYSKKMMSETVREVLNGKV